ncbi:MAG: hypothetical protein RL621_1852 [Bacteroidota bacterium]|jgi:hypothetical protein
MLNDFNKALLLQRGSYQTDIITGYQRVSGSDLKGKASRWKGAYARSKENLFKTFKEAGICAYIVREKNGKLDLYFNQLPNDCVYTRKKYLGLNLWQRT